MAYGFRKSMKVGGMRVNFSKSGVGVSTGIKGLRVGVNAKGKSYVSAGRNGLYYRKTIGSNSVRNTNYSNNSTTPQTSTKGCLIAITFIFFIIGLFIPFLLIIPAAIIIVSILYKVAANAEGKKLEEYKRKINLAISSMDIDKLLSELSEFKNQGIREEKIQSYLDSIYKDLLYKIIEDHKISEEERNIIDFFQTNLSKVQLDKINIDVIEEIVDEIISVSRITEDEEQYLNEVFSAISIPEQQKNEFINTVERFKKIEKIKENGLQPLNIEDEVVVGRICYFKERVELLKSRTLKEDKFFENNGSGLFYITNDSIDIIADGHKKIKIKDIISVEDKNKTLEIVILNRQTPYYFESDDAILISIIIQEVQNKNKR